MPNHTSHDHSPLLEQLLTLDALLHASAVDQAVDVVARHTAGTNVSMILDFGAGTGAGTFALAAKFPAAQVVAVDVDEDMLAGVHHRADESQLSDRISTARADIGDIGFDAGVADVIWSSNAMHEVPDPAAAFGTMFRRLRRGGVVLILEMDSPPMVLPEEHSLLETSLRAAAAAGGPGPDWSEAITAAGFDLIETQSVTSDQVLPADGPGGTYAALELRRLAQHASLALTEEDRVQLRELVIDLSGDHERLDHVHIRGTRTLWAARRP